MRYIVQKSARWNGYEEIFKIFDKDMAQLSYSGYTTYEIAKNICASKNKLDEEKNGNQVER